MPSAFMETGLNWGSLMSARNFVLLLTSPSYSVFVKCTPTRASSTGASRFTCASFHKCSSTNNLLSCELSGFWAAPALTRPIVNRKRQQTFRIMDPLHQRRLMGRTQRKHSSPRIDPPLETVSWSYERHDSRRLRFCGKNFEGLG